MSRSGYTDLFPGMLARDISDRAFLDAIAKLPVPYYLRKQRYSQFCIETHRAPDWSLFALVFGRDPEQSK